MRKFAILFIFSILFIQACNDDNDLACHECDGLGSEKLIMWVDSKYGPCNEADTLKPSCMMVQISDTLVEGAWQPFQQDICGFEYELGYRYQLSVRRKKIDETDDGQPVYKYCLLDILDKYQTFLK